MYCFLRVTDRFVFCVYMQLRRECSLAELMDQETCMVKQIRSLDSDMQTLVYENYNKFISATGEGDVSHSLLNYCFNVVRLCRLSMIVEPSFRVSFPQTL